MTEQTTYAQLAAKVAAAGLHGGADDNTGIITIWGRDCTPHHFNFDAGEYMDLSDGWNDWTPGTIDDCLVAVLATEPAPPASVAELLAACKAALKQREREFWLDRNWSYYGGAANAIAKDPLCIQLRAAITKHEANNPGDAR